LDVLGTTELITKFNFEEAVSWHYDGGLLYSCNKKELLKSKHLIYAHISGGQVKYIGITKGSLRRRMYQYSNPGKGQATNIRINKRIINELKAGKNVHTYIRIKEEKDKIHFNNMVLVPSLEVIESLLINNFETELWNKKS